MLPIAILTLGIERLPRKIPGQVFFHENPITPSPPAFEAANVTGGRIVLETSPSRIFAGSTEHSPNPSIVGMVGFLGLLKARHDGMAHMSSS